MAQGPAPIFSMYSGNKSIRKDIISVIMIAIACMIRMITCVMICIYYISVIYICTYIHA